MDLLFCVLSVLSYLVAFFIIVDATNVELSPSTMGFASPNFERSTEVSEFTNQDIIDKSVGINNSLKGVHDISQLDTDIDTSFERKYEDLNIFPPLDSVVPISIDEANTEFTSVLLSDEITSSDKLRDKLKMINVKVPAFHDLLGELKSNDPRVEINASPKFSLFVTMEHPRMSRIITFISNYLGSHQNIEEISKDLFPAVTYSECMDRLNKWNKWLNGNILSFCSSIVRSDILSIQPEDLPKNILNGRDEVYKLSGIVMSIPIALFTPINKLTWRYLVTPSGQYQAYNAGVIDGFAHFRFLSSKLHDMIRLIHTPNYQFWDDIKVELFNGLLMAENYIDSNSLVSRKTLKMEVDIKKFYTNWFKGSPNCPCSALFLDSFNTLTPLYDGIYAMFDVLSDSFEKLNELFNFSKTPRLTTRNPRDILLRIILPVFVKTENQLKIYKEQYVNKSVLRMFAILEEVDFSTEAAELSLSKFNNCASKFKNMNSFKHSLRNIKRKYSKYIMALNKELNLKLSTPHISSPLYIKGRTFGLKNLFRKDTGRVNGKFYKERNPLKGR
ncbi:hypothetical protein cand_027300 [Cryptosporidium andersoni]|uniref:Uncharacterized protein n=1 Tax=Cryptosporidium andersoni TaxID=117008 RepID=A0A1J4MUZ5_9CRYT|nr:hypothetical protein cand_027300 [Cryptosporidium andersoni]